MFKKAPVISFLISACFALGACTADRVEPGSAEHVSLLQQERLKLSAQAAPEHMRLSYEEALKRAIAYNLDARVSALETLSKEDDIDIARLRAVPDISLSATRYGRNNEGASSSRSIITGAQSLESSYSTERYHQTREMAVQWNTLDLLMAVAESRIAKDEAMIARQRHDKVLQNIERDVHSAYWRAYAYQDTNDTTEKLLTRAQAALANIDQAGKAHYLSASRAADLQSDIAQQSQSLNAAANDLSYAMIELKSLLSIPQNTHLILTDKPDEKNKAAQNLLASDIQKLEEEALLNRPEMRETILQKNIDAQNTRNAILQTLPGANIFFGDNRDDNDFLYDKSWLSFSGTLSQSLSALFTAPARHRAAKNIEELGDARRLSLMAAVMTQVHLARHRLGLSLDMYQDAQQTGRLAAEQSRKSRAEKALGMEFGAHGIAAELAAQTAQIQILQAHADTQDALAGLLNTLGRPVHQGKNGGGA